MKPDPFLISCCICLLAAGCGPGRPATVPVRGAVTLDGKPVAGAQVMLMPQEGGRPAQGVTDDAGRFALETFAPGDGALPGRHAVTVTCRRVSGAAPDADGLEGAVAPGGPKVEWIVPQRYSDPKTSGLSAEVAPGMKPLELPLSSK